MVQKKLKYLQTNIYKDTYAYRIGGDEFIIVTETLKNDDFIQFLNRITLKVSEINLNYQEYQNIHISISTGVAFHFELNTYHFKDLYNLADKRNQKAKETGKNRVLW